MPEDAAQDEPTAAATEDPTPVPEQPVVEAAIPTDPPKDTMLHTPSLIDDYVSEFDSSAPVKKEEPSSVEPPPPVTAVVTPTATPHTPSLPTPIEQANKPVDELKTLKTEVKCIW